MTKPKTNLYLFDELSFSRIVDRMFSFSRISKEDIQYSKNTLKKLNH